jgi:hypothetical protein
MAYKILYIDDLETDSRKKDLENLGYTVKLYDPTSNISDLYSELDKDTNAVILDYRLTKGKNNACFDAPTIAQTLRTKHKDDANDIPLVLMSNEKIKIDEFDKDFTSQDLFDFVLTKEDFVRNKEKFALKLNAFIDSYLTIRAKEFDLEKILDFCSDDKRILHSRIIAKKETLGTNVFKISCLIHDDIVRPIGLLIGPDVLSARLGVDRKSGDWDKLITELKTCQYTGVFSEFHNRWWMDMINIWWNERISPDVSLRVLNAEERVELLKLNLNLNDLTAIEKTEYSESSNFWTICKFSKQALDPFDGIELIKSYLPWQEKEYISIDTALIKMEDYKNLISKVDKNAIRELLTSTRK